MFSAHNILHQRAIFVEHVPETVTHKLQVLEDILTLNMTRVLYQYCILNFGQSRISFFVALPVSSFIPSINIAESFVYLRRQSVLSLLTAAGIYLSHLVYGQDGFSQSECKKNILLYALFATQLQRQAKLYSYP